ncbi:MAG: hypothetical protein RLZZ336_1738, partial [Cyanobacteriota bacterium]
MSAETPYSRLLDWVASDVCPQASAAIDDGLRSIAQAVHQSADVRQHVCGLECHHDGSGRFDFFLACLSNLCNFEGLLMPPWWDHLLAACDPIDRNYALQGGLFAQDLIGQMAATASADQVAKVVLPDAHSLEFDHDCQGSRLAGVFQWIYPSAQLDAFAVPDPAVWADTWNRLPLGGALGQSAAWCEGLFEQVRLQLGWPLWAGFMCGRGNLLKLGFRQDAQLLERLRLFLAGKALPDEGVTFLAALSDCVRDPRDELRVSMDVDLAAQRLLPSLALEYYPASVTAETQNWQVLDQLASHFDLGSEVLADVRTKLCRLPLGIRPGPGSLALQRLLPALPLPGGRAAKLSHYKLSLLPGGSWKLKSYLSLTWFS